MGTHARFISAAAIATMSSVIAVVAPRPAGADPVTVTGGYLQGHASVREGFLSFTGPGFVLNLSFDEGFFTNQAFCIACPPGTAVDLSSRVDTQSTSGRGSATIDGVLYPQISVDERGLVGMFTTPVIRLEGTSSTVVTAPFVFQGTVNAFLTPAFEGPREPVFSLQLFGIGRATARFEYSRTFRAFDALPEIRYDFQDPSPVPEPGTLMLCSLGAAALGIARRRQRARSR